MDRMVSGEYSLALKMGRKECAELSAAGKPTNPEVLDDLLPPGTAEIVKDLGILEIPSNRIVGTKSAGRIMAFSPSFRPIMSPDSEFAMKWMRLCDAHLSDTGIKDPIECYEYLGKFYVQEGNKRVSVLRHFDSPAIAAHVRRIMPAQSDDPRIQAYYEFVEFYNLSGIYQIQYVKPGCYAKLLSRLGRSAEEKWTEEVRRTFRAYYGYFLEAFAALDTKGTDVLPEEALLMWLQVYPFAQLGQMSSAELKKSLVSVWDDVIASTKAGDVKVQTKVEDTAKAGILDRMTAPDRLKIAFVHQMNPTTSAWALGHDQGRQYLEEVFGSKLEIRSYFGADTAELADAALEQAVAEGANVVFATAPLLSPSVLKAAVKYPKVEFFNCAVDQPYSSVRSYYARIYEGKFITGAIAGALAQNNRIGYIAAYPIMGEPASINAFALGAQMTNPRAQIEVKWSCLPGNPQAEFFADGIRVVSNRETPVQSKMFLDFCTYGTYLMDDKGGLVSLASPVWVWGRFYERIIRSIFSGLDKKEKAAGTVLNYWLGMDAGVINVSLSSNVPTGIQVLAGILRRDLSSGSINPFFRKIIAQDGSVKNDGSTIFTPEQLIHMDWLCDNVIGSIPEYTDVLPMAEPMVRAMGLHRDSIHTEGGSRENTDRS